MLSSIYRTALERAGHNLQESREAGAAIHLADQSHIDLVVLELQLPGHSGVEFLYEFRSYPEWQTQPVILHSCIHPDNLTVQADQLRRLGVIEHLYKPETSLDLLVQKVGQLSQVS